MSVIHINITRDGQTVVDADTDGLIFAYMNEDGSAASHFAIAGLHDYEIAELLLAVDKVRDKIVGADKLIRIAYEARSDIKGWSYKELADLFLYKLREKYGSPDTHIKKTWDNISLRRGIEELGLSVRAYKALSRSRIVTVGDVVEADVRRVRGIGNKSLHDIEAKIHALGFKMSWEE